MMRPPNKVEQSAENNMNEKSSPSISRRASVPIIMGAFALVSAAVIWLNNSSYAGDRKPEDRFEVIKVDPTLRSITFEVDGSPSRQGSIDCFAGKAAVTGVYNGLLEGEAADFICPDGGGMPSKKELTDFLNKGKLPTDAPASATNPHTTTTQG